MTTNVPQIQWTAQGLVIPTASAILAGVQADINAAFGGNLNFTNQSTPQAQLAASLAAIIQDDYATIAYFVNNVDPDVASGFMQDAIARIYFLNRNPGLPTTVQLTCIGALGTNITVGAQAQDTSGNIYVCTQAGQIPVGGSITLPFANAELGPIACPANTVNTIYLAIPGWDSVNNASEGVVGSNVESSTDFEFRREQSVAKNAHGSLPSIYGAVFDVEGVIDVYAYENVTDNTIIVGSTNYPLLPHSLYVGVTGGAAQDIANAIWTKKNEGSNMNGNTTEVVVDDSGYAFPPPQYNITFNNNAENPVTINLVITIVMSTALPSTIAADVTAAVTAQFNGTNGGTRARSGALLLAASYYGPVANCEGPGIPVQVLSILIGTAFAGLGTLVNGSETLTITTVSSGALAAGAMVTGTSIASGTSIIQQLTGSAGGVGTYQMSKQALATVAAPEAIAGAGGTSALVGIDQAPVLGTVTTVLV